ncbi:bifunctional folylpolyglutamate synthase/dihydrofolate synthase [Salaquimonas pukyongi]|uniref:bifunctional folylpolyglutamate synthase/dihydrofolate synthase n=1 Tax=Salaquimonas pukyongi TaxID=2712698 RepID=UPI00096B758B|nr:folylpolyglutamate synthase/dihydrofolate synthase family protein [Salaquimonas pukyongi]
MSAESAINRLLEIHPKGFDLSLGRITVLLDKLGNPHLAIPPVFHIAGTNGKGSTAAFLRAILEAAGKSVHVHTSPHLVSWTERYRLGAPGGGSLVSDRELETAVNRVAEANEGKPITVFEIMSAVGFLLFSEHPADYAILEVGLGGRFDATNVIGKPAVSIITPIDFDHMAHLGNTVEKIAFEKAGIIKRDVPVIVAEQQDAALDVICSRAEELNAPVTVARQDFDWYEQAGRLIFQDEGGLLDIPLPRLAGAYQMANAATAIASCRKVLPQLGNTVFEEAMKAVRWPGRFERLPEGRLTKALSEKIPDNSMPEIWIDGGHNPQAAAMLVSELGKLRERDARKCCLLAGMLTTKEPAEYFSAFEGLADFVVTVPVPDSEAGFSPGELAAIAADCGLPAEPAENIQEGLQRCADRVQDEPCRILVCGSLYLIGEVLRQNATPPL